MNTHREKPVRCKNIGLTNYTEFWVSDVRRAGKQSARQGGGGEEDKGFGNIM